MDEQRQDSNAVKSAYVLQDPETGKLSFDFNAFEEALKTLPEDPAQIMHGLEELLRNILVPEAGALPERRTDVLSDLAVYIRTDSQGSEGKKRKKEGAKTRFERLYGSGRSHFLGLMGNSFDISQVNVNKNPLEGRIPRSVKTKGITYAPKSIEELRNLMLAVTTSLVFDSLGMPAAYIERADELGKAFTEGNVSLLPTLAGADQHYGQEDPAGKFNQYIEETLVLLHNKKGQRNSDLLLIVSNLYTRITGLNTDENFAHFVSVIEPYVRKASEYLKKQPSQISGKRDDNAPRDIGQDIALLRKLMSGDNVRGATPEEAATNVVEIMHAKLGVLQFSGQSFDAGQRSDVIEIAAHGDYGLDLTDASQRAVMLTDGSVIKDMARIPVELESLLFDQDFAGRMQVTLPKNGKSAIPTPVDDGLLTAFYIPQETAVQASVLQSLLNYLGDADRALFLEQHILTEEEARAGRFTLNAGKLTIDLAVRGITQQKAGGRIVCVADHLIYSRDKNADYGVIPWSMANGARQGFLLAQGFNDHNLLASHEARNVLSEELSRVMADLRRGEKGHVDALTGLPLFVGDQPDYDRLKSLVRKAGIAGNTPYIVVFAPDHFVIPEKDGKGLAPNMKVAEALGWDSKRAIHEMIAKIGSGIARYAICNAGINSIETAADLSILGDTSYSLGRAPHLALIGVMSVAGSKSPDEYHAKLVAGDENREGLSALLKVPNAEMLYTDKGQTSAYLSRNGTPFTYSLIFQHMDVGTSMIDGVRMAVQGAENLLRVQYESTGASLRRLASGQVLSASEALAKQGGRVNIKGKR